MPDPYKFLHVETFKTKSSSHMWWLGGNNIGPVHKGANHVLKAVSDRNPLLIVFVIWTTCVHKHCNGVPITNRICALRGNILFLLRSPRWLTRAWLQCAFPKCARTNHVLKEFFAFTCPQNQAFYAIHDPKRLFFRVLKCVSNAWFERALHSPGKVPNHVPKRLSERDSFLCEQAHNYVNYCTSTL